MEIGNSKENLILKTAGKLKVQWGKKFIDLLDNNGNLNVDTRKQESSIEELQNINSELQKTIEDINETNSQLESRIVELEDKILKLEDRLQAIEESSDDNESSGG